MTTATRRAGASAGSRAPAPTWLLGLVRHRTWAQRRLLTVSGAVALLVAVLTATLAILADATDRYGVPAVLGAEPSRARISLTLGSPDAPVSEVLAAAQEAITATLGVPVTTEVVVTSEMYDVARAGQMPGYAYLDRRDGVADTAVLVAGRWPGAGPDAGRGTAEDPLPVAAPAVGAFRLGVGLGDTWRLASQAEDGADVVVRVVGLYDVPDRAADHWARDRLGGSGYEPSYPVPFSGGFLVTEAVGPLVVAPDAADGSSFAVRRIILRADPDLAGVTAARLPAVRSGTAVLEDEVGYRLDDLVRDVDLGTALSVVLRGAATGVVVTRAGTGVATVLLLMVAVAALLQTARLIGEARSAEHDLMRARGASRRQLFAAVAFEATLLGVGVALLAPPLALVVTRALGGPFAAALGAGLPDALRALPWTAWAAGALVGLLLVVVSTVPLLRAPATFVEGQHARGRRTRGGSLARLAADVAAVGAAVLAWTQLQAYGGPLVGAGSRLTADPVLVTGPALLVLAAVLVGARVLPLAGRLLERAARRGRGLVVPLAGWDVGRRSHHATAAVLLLAVAISSASFGLTQRATWQRSQADQAAFAVGAPVVVQDGGAQAGDAAVLAAGGTVAHPVLRDRGRVATRSIPGFDSAGVVGDRLDVVAATASARATLDRGRVAREGGAAVAALPGAAPTAGGVDLGEGVLGFSTTVVVEGPQLPEQTAVQLRLVLEDDAGVLSTVGLGLHPLVAGSTPVAVLLEDVRVPVGVSSQESADALAAAAGRRAEPLRLVGLQTIVVALDPELRWTYNLGYDVQVVLRDLVALRPAADVTVVGVDDWASEVGGAEAGIVRDPLEVSATGWWRTRGMSDEPIDPLGGVLWARMSGLVDLLPDAPAAGAVVAWEPVDEVPTVITADVASTLPDVMDDGYELSVAEASLRAVVAGVVPHVPTTDGGSAVAADYTTLARAVVEAGAPGGPPVEWWLDPPDPTTYVAALPGGVGRPAAERATTVVSAATDLLEHPVGVAVPLVLALLALGGALVAGVGFAVHTAVTVRERDLELAQLRAVGLSRGRLTAAVGLESAILAGLGVTLGVGAGVGVAAVVGRLLVVGVDGDPPLPAVELVVPVSVAWLALGLIGLVAVLTVVVAAGQRTADPAALLRAGDAR